MFTCEWRWLRFRLLGQTVWMLDIQLVLKEFTHTWLSSRIIVEWNREPLLNYPFYPLFTWAGYYLLLRPHHRNLIVMWRMWGGYAGYRVSQNTYSNSHRGFTGIRWQAYVGTTWGDRQSDVRLYSTRRIDSLCKYFDFVLPVSFVCTSRSNIPTVIDLHQIICQFQS